MMKFIKKNGICLILLIFACICLYLSTGHYTNLYGDIGREMYYPVEILNGKILYKDLFCIYGPSSYLFNALIFKIFGIKLASLYGVGVVCALLITGFTYKIARKFLKDWPSFSIAFFVTVTGCLSTRVFNFTLPYSYAMLFGLVSFLISIYFLINYTEDKKPLNLAVAGFFAGAAASNKYDFALYLIPLLIAGYKTKRVKPVLIYFSIAFLIPFLVLFFEGLTIGDLANALETIRGFALSDSLKTFYVSQGAYYYTNRIWSVWLSKSISLILPFILASVGTFLFEKKHNLWGIPLVVTALVTIFIFADVTGYLFVTFLTFVLLIFLCKKNTYTQNIFITSALLTALKTIWGFSHVNYGLYFTGIIFISFFILAKKEFLVNALACLLFGASLNFLVNNLNSIKATNERVITDKGFLKTVPWQGKITNKLLRFVNNIKEENPYIMIFPEGLSINFLTSKKTLTDGRFNSLIPLYIQGSNEEKIIGHYVQNPPKYLVLSSLYNKDYGQGSICNDYAKNFCQFIYHNYTIFDKIELERHIFFIFKLK